MFGRWNEARRASAQEVREKIRSVILADAWLMRCAHGAYYGEAYFPHFRLWWYVASDNWMPRIREQFGSDLLPTIAVGDALAELMEERSEMSSEDVFIACGGNPATEIGPAQVRAFRFQLSPTAIACLPWFCAVSAAC